TAIELPSNSRHNHEPGCLTTRTGWLSVKLIRRGGPDALRSCDCHEPTVRYRVVSDWACFILSSGEITRPSAWSSQLFSAGVFKGEFVFRSRLLSHYLDYR